MPVPVEGETPREERIAKAKKVAAERGPELRDRHEAERASAAGRVSRLRKSELRDRVRMLEGDRQGQFIGPVQNPVSWENARRACRDYVIDAVRRGDRVVYDELRILTYEVTGLLLGHAMFARMCEEINEDSDQCLLSSWVVTQETRTPGAGFFAYARSQGYDLPLETLQRQAREYFAQQ